MSKKYKCPYCDTRTLRSEMSSHIEDKHIDLVPENMTINQLAFNIVNKKDKGTCVECKSESKWNEKNKRYDRFCSEKCRVNAGKKAKENMKRVYNKEHLLDDPDIQIKMLKSRKISGKYKFRDGTLFDYVGKLEKSCLEYLDKVLEIESKDIITDYPIIEYEIDNVKRFYIPDFYILPYNLIIEVKDGGNNKNNNPAMINTRLKTLAKESKIKNMNKYNYIRLTDNNFDQLIKCISEIKNNFIDKEEQEFVHMINESVYNIDEIVNNLKNHLY